MEELSNMEKWVKFLNLKSAPHFGALIDFDHIKKYFYLDESINQSKDFAINYFKDTSDYSNIMISAPRGAGKTSFINYLRYLSEADDESCPFDLIVVDLEDYGPKNIDFLVPYIKSRLIEHFLKSRLLSSKTESIINNANGIKHDTDAIYFLLNTREEYLSKITDRKKFVFKSLIVVVDQIDFLTYRDLVGALQRIFIIFAPPGKTQHLIKVICTRDETEESAKKDGANYFSTYFHRHIKLTPPPLREILNKRFHLKTKKAPKPIIGEIHEILDVDIDLFITKFNNKNLRRMLEQLRCIFENISPYETKPDGESLNLVKEKMKLKFFDVLLSNNYVQNYFKRVNPRHKYPIFKVILEALSVYPILDRSFYTVITKEFKFLGKEVTKALYELQRQDVVRAEYHDVDQKSPFLYFTSAGEVYLALINDQSYAKKCKADELWPKIPLWQKIFPETKDFERLARKYLTY